MDKGFELLKNRLLELGNKAYQQNAYTYTNFLDTYEQSIYHECCSQTLSFIDTQLVGGHAYWDRAVLTFGSENMFGYQAQIPIVCICISPLQLKFSDDLNHRDFLGALMNIGIERSLIGDILVQEDNQAYVFCMDHIAEFIIGELHQVKHTSVSAQIIKHDVNIEPRYMEKDGFVSSCRLDAVIGLAYQLSRSQSIVFIQGKKVFVNGRLITSNSYILKDEDVISVRGFGKFLFVGVTAHSKKGRSHIIWKQFV